MKIQVSLFIIAILLLASCSSKNKNEKAFVKSPVDDFIKDLDSIQNFTIILYDMNQEGSEYKHRYKIITEEEQELSVQNAEGEDSSFVSLVPQEDTTSWYTVNETFFDEHVNDMGMELASKTDGKVSKTVAPPGYSNYVGNPKYGTWKDGDSNGGGSFWEFYGKYAFMTSMFHMIAGPSIYRSNYIDYNNNYRGNRSYYGTTGANGKSQYGTFSKNNLNRNSNFSQKLSNNSDFKNKVNNSVQRSTSAKTSAGSRSSTTSRSGSRYNNRSSSRSRSSSSGGK